MYYGFVGVTLAWQVAFLVIASDPVRYRTFMLTAMLEKPPAQAAAIVAPDGVLGLLFVWSFFKTPVARV